MNGERRGRINTVLIVFLVILGVASIGVMAWNTHRSNISSKALRLLGTQGDNLVIQGDKLDVMAATSLVVAREARLVSDAQAVIIADLVRRVAALEAGRR